MVVDRRSWFLSVQVMLQFLAVGGFVLGSVVDLHGVDGDSGRVAWTHFVGHN